MQYQLSTKASRTHRFPDAPDAIPLLNFVNGGSRKKNYIVTVSFLAIVDLPFVAICIPHKLSPVSY